MPLRALGLRKRALKVRPRLNGRVLAGSIALSADVFEKRILNIAKFSLVRYTVCMKCGRQKKSFFLRKILDTYKASRIISLLTAHCSLLTAHCSLLTAHCSLLTAHCSLRHSVFSAPEERNLFYKKISSHEADFTSAFFVSPKIRRSGFATQIPSYIAKNFIRR